MKFWHAAITIIACLTSAIRADNAPRPLASGLANPASVCCGPKGVLYVTEIGEPDQPGDGKISAIDKGIAQTLATGLDDPLGIVFYKDNFYVADGAKIVKVNLQGKVSDYATADQFPTTPLFLNDIAVDHQAGIFLVSDSGDRKGSGSALFRIDIRLHKITAIADQRTIPELHTPSGVAFEGSSAAIVADMATGSLYRVRTGDRTATKIASGLDGCDGLVWDDFGRLYITSSRSGKVFAIPRPGMEPILIGASMHSAADCCLEVGGQNLLIPDRKSGTLVRLSTTIPGWEVESSPLPVMMQPAFTKLQWTGWKNGVEDGKPTPLRPVFLTHAGDGSGRLFVLIQQGIIHTFASDDSATETKIFLDLSDRVRYSDRANEEGLLGLAFHPQFKTNGEFFLFYTDNRARLTNVVSRFRMKTSDPAVADPASEEVLLKFEKPFENHNGGTIAFGPDGYLYITHGDGGAGGDPRRNGQNPNTWFGKVLRIDVDHKQGGKNYAIPTDNPFANGGGAPEVWCLGLRNVWRMAFDRQTGRLWAGDVGQGLFEEVNILTRGGNYGWNLREGLHPFGGQGVGPTAGLIEPLWEYHHILGPSITGGLVYRGAALPELDGAYIYGDYVSNRIWALRFDPKQGRVVANQLIKGTGVPIMSFGEDDHGEIYALGASVTGRGIFRIVRAKQP